MMIKIENKKSALFVLLFPAILKLFVLSTTVCIIGCVPKQTGFQTQNARLAIPGKCAHTERKLRWLPTVLTVCTPEEG